MVRSAKAFSSHSKAFVFFAELYVNDGDRHRRIVALFVFFEFIFELLAPITLYAIGFECLVQCRRFLFRFFLVFGFKKQRAF
ncbi:MAG: hypothetical protein ABI954_08075 [Pyrinomonadaceae bacterium]